MYGASSLIQLNIFIIKKESGYSLSSYSLISSLTKLIPPPISSTFFHEEHEEPPGLFDRDSEQDRVKGAFDYVKESGTVYVFN